MTPLILAIKALVSANPEMKKEFAVNREALVCLLECVTTTFDHQNKKEKDNKEHLHIVGTLLMCEMGIKLF